MAAGKKAPAATEAEAMADPLEGLLAYEVRRASAAIMTAVAEALAPLDLRWTDAMMLMVIGAHPGCTQSEICRILHVQPANTVPIITQLTRAGSVKRVPGDGRAIALFLTPEGIALLRRVKRVVAAQEARIARRLTQGRKGELIEMLRTVGKDACC